MREELVNKKGLSTWVIVSIVVIIIIVAGVAAYVLYGGGGEPTPTPTPTPTSPVEGATSMRFDVDLSVEGGVEKDSFAAKNLGTSNVLLRVDVTDVDGVAFTYLMNQTGQTVWVNYAGTWMDDSANFATQYWNSDVIGNVALENYMAALADWSGTGDYEGDGFTIYSITVNPDLGDSAFEPPS